MKITDFFKDRPFYYSNKKEILKEYKGLRFFKMSLNNYWCVEDSSFISQYTTKKEALKHFNYNKKIELDLIKMRNKGINI